VLNRKRLAEAFERGMREGMLVAGCWMLDRFASIKHQASSI